MNQQRERLQGIWMLPEMISSLLVLFALLWEFGFQRISPESLSAGTGVYSEFLMLACLVWLNSSIVLIHAGLNYFKDHLTSAYVVWQALVGLAASLIFALFFLVSPSGWFLQLLFWLGVLLTGFIGCFGLINIRSYFRFKREKKEKINASAGSPAVVFFSAMLAFVLASTLILLTPGATYDSIGLVDAFFSCASSTSNTGLYTVDVASTFTPLGKFVILTNIQVGGVGVMTFSYFVLLMVGKKLAVQDSATFSGLLDQQGVRVVPYLIKSAIFGTIVIEVLGSIFLYLSWKGVEGVPQDHLWPYAIFHSVSAFCNAGISIFPNNMAEPCIAYNKWSQTVMMIVVFFGTMGFGIYLEAISRMRQRLTGVVQHRRWSTHSWLVIRATMYVTLGGVIILSLLGIFEPSSNPQTWWNTIWESLWNTVGRSTGFNISVVDDYGYGYKFFLCLLMFIGGNPAGTGGGIFVPVFALCILEVARILRARQDLEIHQRRIARVTVERAMATVVTATAWIFSMILIIFALEPEMVAAEHGFQRVTFEVLSAFTTAGFSLGVSSDFGTVSKIILAFTMIFGRVGVFTFMMIFVRPAKPKILRYPETKLPLS